MLNYNFSNSGSSTVDANFAFLFCAIALNICSASVAFVGQAIGTETAGRFGEFFINILYANLWRDTCDKFHTRPFEGKFVYFKLVTRVPYYKFTIKGTSKAHVCMPPWVDYRGRNEKRIF